ncbi:MAG: tetratricopeptide repeat protein, partial [Flavisolibacter sp.]
MKKYLLAITLFLMTAIVIAQPGKKTVTKEKPTTQSEIDKMMEDAMKDMSPEEKKQMQEGMQLAKQMQQKGMTGDASTSNVPKIPKKQITLLTRMPNLVSQQLYNAYLTTILAECKKHVPETSTKEVDKLISKYSNNSETLVNLAPALFLQQKPGVAIYAAIKIAMGDPGDILLQDNLAVILHQTGYPQKALPILKFLSSQNSYPVILNNMGQSYLSLGDTANARKSFMGCLIKDPDHCEANCGMGLLLSEEGKISEAIPYIIKSLKSGYTETADALLKKHNVKLKYKDMRQDVPEYFNPNKYKPIAPAYAMESVEPTVASRMELEEQMHYWMNENKKVNDAQESKMEKENLVQLADRTRGFFSKSPFSKKAQLMLLLIGEEYGELIAADYKNHYLAIDKEYKMEMEKRLKDMYGGNQRYDNEYEECQKKIEILNDYLSKSAKNHEAYQRATLPGLFEWTNQSLYWWYFLTNEEHYDIYFHDFVSGFFEALHEYDQMQALYPTPLWITSTCKNVKEPVKVKTNIDSMDFNCPINVKVNAGIGSYKLNCKGMEIEGGELAVFNFEKDFKSGEFSFAFGLGAEARLAIFSAGTKGQMFFRFNKDLSPIDCGLKFESGGEANVGGYMVEEKMVA